MGYDVYGLNPQINVPKSIEVKDWFDIDWNKMTEDEKEAHFKAQDKYERENPGVYFRANVWYWRPVWNFVCAACEDFLSDRDLEAGCSNSGDKISKTKAKRIASRLRKLDKQGIIQKWEDEMMIPYNEARVHNKIVDNELDVFQEKMKSKYHANIVPAEYNEKDREKWDSIYSKRSWASSYPPSRDLIMEFATFCEESGGFEIC